MSRALYTSSEPDLTQPAFRRAEIERGQPRYGLLVFEVVSSFCLILIAFLFGMAYSHVRLKDMKRMTPMRLLVLAIYVISGIHIIVLRIMLVDVGLTRHEECNGVMVACLVIYLVDKGCLYLYLVERAHAVRASHRPRWRDWIWVVGISIEFIGFMIMAVVSFLHLSGSLATGICSINLGRGDVLIDLVVDVFINVGLTGLFIFQLIPALRFRRQLIRSELVQLPSTEIPSSLSGSTDDVAVQLPLPEPWKHRDTHKPNNLERLFRRTVLGTVLVLAPTMANLIVLNAKHGVEQAWLCCTICGIDVTLQLCVVAWLTVDPTGAEK